MRRREFLKSSAGTFAAVLLSCPKGCVQPKTLGNACIGTASKGSWVSGGTLGVLGAHAALMPGGMVLVFGYNHAAHYFDEEAGFQLWNPATRSPVANGQSFSGYNPFCCGQSFLGDGRLFVAGGYKSGDPFRASSADQVRLVSVSGTSVTWDSSFGKMQNVRWYPTLVTLGNGNGFIIGGSAPFAADNWKDTDEDFELFDLASNHLVRQSESKKKLPEDGPFQYPNGDKRQKVADGKRLAGLYPLTHLLPNVPNDDAPNGLLFVLTESFVRIYNPDTNAIVRTKQDAQGFRTWWTQASSVLLPIDIDTEGNGPKQVRIMIFGGGTLGVGGDDGKIAPALNFADVWMYDVASRNVSFESRLTLNRSRFMGDSMLLPDGNIILVGGASTGFTNDNSGRIVTAELIQPPVGSAGSATDMGNASTKRGYHASALLLPDGSAFLTGGNGQWDSETNASNTPPEEWKSVEIFEPPYFTAGPRPQILDAPATIHTGDEIRVITDCADVQNTIVLTRHGARTHSLDTDQRLLRLQATRSTVSGGNVVLTGHMPHNPTYAPPGPYMLWVLRRCGNQDVRAGIPSTAKFVSVQNPM